MLKPESVKCRNCIFFAYGYCKRYPPQLVDRYISINMTHNGGTSNGTESRSPNVEYPLVNETEFCGEFVPQDNLTAIEWVAWKKGLLEDVRASNL